MNEQAKVESWNLDDVYRSLKGDYEDLMKLKPNDRSDQDRAIQIVLTDLENILAYYSMYILYM